MASAHQTCALACLQQRLHAIERIACCCCEGTQILQGKQVRLRGELCLVLRDDVCQRVREVCVRHSRRDAVRGRHGSPEPIGEPLVDAPGFGKPVESLAFVEPPHLDGPFHRLAFAGDRKPPCGIASNGHDVAVNRGRERAVDLDLGFARGPAFAERGKIEKWESARRA